MISATRTHQEEVARASSREVSNLLLELAQLRDQPKILWAELAGLTPEYVTLRRGEPLSWKALREVLAL